MNGILVGRLIGGVKNTLRPISYESLPLELLHIVGLVMGRILTEHRKEVTVEIDTEIMSKPDNKKMWEPCAYADHDWQKDPITRGRYKCRKCKVVGHQIHVLMGNTTNSKQPITYYKCVKCHGPTTRQRNLCPNCAGA